MAVNIPLSHQVVKVPGQRVYAVSDWNANHQITSDINLVAYNLTTTGTGNFGILNVTGLSTLADTNQTGILFALGNSGAPLTDGDRQTFATGAGGTGTTGGIPAGDGADRRSYTGDGGFTFPAGVPANGARGGDDNHETGAGKARKPAGGVDGRGGDENHKLGLKGGPGARDGQWTCGDGGITNYISILSDGDVVFVGSSGLPYGCIDGENETVTCTLINVWYQVTFDTVGVFNNTTISVANNDITINKTGDYKIGVTACFHVNNAQDIELMVKKENGTVDLGIHLFQTTGVAAKIENVAGNCIVPITATDTLELWVRCTSAAGKDVVFDHVDLNCGQWGG